MTRLRGRGRGDPCLRPGLRDRRPTGGSSDSELRLTGTLRDGRRSSSGWPSTSPTPEGRATRPSEERLRLALAAARMGIWTLDVAADAQMRDANLNRLLGLEPVETRAAVRASSWRHVHPDDREAVAAAFDASVRAGPAPEPRIPVVRPDGAVRWLRDQGDVFGEDGVGVAPPGRGVRRHHRPEGGRGGAPGERGAAAADRRERHRLRHLHPGRRPPGHRAGAPAPRRSSATPSEEILGRSGDILFTPEDRAAGAPEEEARTALREGRAADERWHLRKDGIAVLRLRRAHPAGRGRLARLRQGLRDLTDRKRMEDDLREARDELEARVAERTAELARANEACGAGRSRAAAAAGHGAGGRAAADLARAARRPGPGADRPDPRPQGPGAGRPGGRPGRARLPEVEAIVGRIGREAHDLAVELRPTALDDIGLGSGAGHLRRPVVRADRGRRRLPAAGPGRRPPAAGGRDDGLPGRAGGAEQRRQARRGAAGQRDRGAARRAS